MIRYESIRLNIPANGENSDTILTVPDGKKVILRGIANTADSGHITFLEVRGDRLARFWSRLSADYCVFLPLDLEVNGPEEIKVGAEDRSGSTSDTYISIMYEE